MVKWKKINLGTRYRIYYSPDSFSVHKKNQEGKWRKERMESIGECQSLIIAMVDALIEGIHVETMDKHVRD